MNYASMVLLTTAWVVSCVQNEEDGTWDFHDNKDSSCGLLGCDIK
jgi:hypothetical protein